LFLLLEQWRRWGWS